MPEGRGRRVALCPPESNDLSGFHFHIVANHPFVDGNKRTGLLAALVFLDLNGVVLDYASEDLYTLTMAVASGEMTGDQVTAELRRIAALD